MTDTKTLNNGIKMPVLGYGTYPWHPKQLETSIVDALDVGIRRFDTAWSYENEELIGNVIKKSGISRNEIFITTKVHFNQLFDVVDNVAQRKTTLKTELQSTFERLKTDYIDLLLIHWPWFNSSEIWQEMEGLYN